MITAVDIILSLEILNYIEYHAMEYIRIVMLYTLKFMYKYFI